MSLIDYGNWNNCDSGDILNGMLSFGSCSSVVGNK